MILTRLLRRYLNITPTVSDDLMQTAYHKSGHIVLAYSYGYSCHRVDLKEIENIDIHYKEDLMLVAGILSYSIDPCLFDNLPEFNKRKAASVTERLINMMSAGYLAQKKYTAGADSLSAASEEILNRPPASIDRLQIFLDNYCGEKADPFAKSFAIQSLSFFMSRPENWKLVDTLARNLLNARGYTLDQHEIEKIINNGQAIRPTFKTPYIHPVSEYKNRQFPKTGVTAGAR